MTEEKDLGQVPDTSGIDIVEGERLTEMSAEETAVLEPLDSAEDVAEDAAGEEPEKKRRRVLPFLQAHKVAAGGIAAALVVGAIGVGVVSLQAADAGTGGVTAEQKADSKTPAAKTGEKAAPGSQAKDAAKPAGEAGAPDANAAETTQAEDSAAREAAATDPAAPAAEGGSQASASGGEKADPSSGTASGSKQSSGGSESSAGSSSGTSASSGGSSGSSSSGSSGSSSSGGSSKPASKPAHEHDWQPVTDKQWVPNIVTVQDAYDEPIYEYVTVCNCGEVFENANDWADHNEEYAIQGIGGHNSHGEKRQTGTKHHDAVKEDQGHYETVTTGYKCSCGATK